MDIVLGKYIFRTGVLSPAESFRSFEVSNIIEPLIFPMCNADDTRLSLSKN
jgi:hypothetical protein